MKLLKTLLIISPVVGGLVTAPVVAQNDDMPDDDPMVTLEETLDDLDQMISFDFGPGMWWTDASCEDGEECDVRVLVDDDHQFVIVNGDTVSSMGWPIPHHGSFAHKFGPEMRHRPKLDFHGDFDKFMHRRRDPALRTMEKEARDLARKTRRADGSEKAMLEKELTEKLNAIFDYKLDQGKKAIENAEKRLGKLKERQSKRKSARDEIIKNRKNELLGTEPYLEW